MPADASLLLHHSPPNPVLPARDGDRARAFYRDVLGLELPSGPGDDPMMFRAGNGSTLVVTEIPGREPPPFPVVSFLVEDIEGLVAELRARGAEMAPLSEAASFAGTAGARSGDVVDFGPVKSAFVRDSEGNLLTLNEIVGQPVE